MALFYEEQKMADTATTLNNLETELAKTRIKLTEQNTLKKRLITTRKTAFDKYIGSEPGSPERDVLKKKYYDAVTAEKNAVTEVGRLSRKIETLKGKIRNLKQGGSGDQKRESSVEGGLQIPDGDNAYVLPAGSSPETSPATPYRYPTTARQQKPLPQLVRRDGNPLQPGEGRYPAMAYDEDVHEPWPQDAVERVYELYPEKRKAAQAKANGGFVPVYGNQGADDQAGIRELEEQRRIEEVRRRQEEEARRQREEEMRLLKMKEEEMRRKKEEEERRRRQELERQRLAISRTLPE